MEKQKISPLFGTIALELRLCTRRDVQAALETQREARSVGREATSIGQILVARGALKPGDVRTVMTVVEQQAVRLDVTGYADLKLLARDERALTFRGRSLEDGRSVTIKVLRFGLVGSPDDVAAFVEVARTLEQLRHRNIVELVEAGRMDGAPYLVLEHIQGPHLGELVEESGGLPEPELLRIATRTAEGLAHAHSLGVLHGSLRPEAVIMPRAGEPKITEFAFFGPVVADEDSSDPKLESLHYLPPEQLQGRCRGSRRGDVYSLGALLFHAVAKRPPFRGGYREVVRQQMRRVPPDPRVHSPSLSRGTAALIRRMLAKDPAARPEGMKRVIAELESASKTRDEPVQPVRPISGRLLSRRR